MYYEVSVKQSNPRERRLARFVYYCIRLMKAAEIDRAINKAAKRGYKATKQLYKKIMRKVRGNDVRYFNTTKRGDINDWRKQLH